jgi:hypothetical protein
MRDHRELNNFLLIMALDSDMERSNCIDQASKRRNKLLGDRSMVGQRTLTPSIKVQILVPQPNKIKWLAD